MKNKKYVLLTTIMVILLSLPILCSTTAARKTEVKANGTNKQTTVSEPAGYFKDSANLDKITNIINIIQQKFVGKKNPTKQELYEYAMAGLVNGLDDPYSEYLTKKIWKVLQKILTGNM